MSLVKNDLNPFRSKKCPNCAIIDNSNFTVLMIIFSTHLEGIVMHSLKSLNDPEVITLLAATSSLVDPSICSTEEPQSLFISDDQIRAMFELKAITQI